jgi:hypothetical protein
VKIDLTLVSSARFSRIYVEAAPPDQGPGGIELREGKPSSILAGQPADLLSQFFQPPSRQILVGSAETAAYLLAVSLEDGIVDARRGGTIEVVPDVG